MILLRHPRLRWCLIGAAAWAVLDLALIHGPLHRMLNYDERSSKAAGPHAVVARVAGVEITRSQLDRAVRERLWLDGRDANALAPAELEHATRAALDELIDHELLRRKSAAMAKQLRVTPEELDQRLNRYAARFASRDEMRAALQTAGLGGERAFRERLAARIQQEKFVESQVAPLATVTRDEARAWFDEHRNALALPERVELRHVFLPTLDHPSEEAKAKLEAALAELTGGAKDFAAIARDLSEDPASKDRGGSLGWMSRQRMPEDFAETVFALPDRKPTVVRSLLGWHLVEVTGRKPAEPRNFETVEDDVTRALHSVKRDRAVAACRAALRKDPAATIEVLLPRQTKD
jgi:parvulin-like peptidyl-prolyl isomerase